MRKIGWLIYNRTDAKKNKAYIDWMLEEAKNLGMNLQFYYREDLQIGHRNNQLFVDVQYTPAEPPAYAIVRTIEPLLTKQLEMLGTVCYNSSLVAEMANNKAKTHQYINTLGIPMSDTVYCQGPALTDLSFPFIAKEVHGRGGKSVYLIENSDQLSSLPNEGEWLIQKPAVFGKDVRVFVVGKKIIAAVLRESATNFKANYTLGGSASLYELSDEESGLVQKIIDTFDFGMVGIDFIFDEEGHFLFNEIEDVVGSRTLSAVSDINIVREYLDFIQASLT
jgi:gamma-F420-2:alpha-L-glutamate ligase